MERCELDDFDELPWSYYKIYKIPDADYNACYDDVDVDCLLVNRNAAELLPVGVCISEFSDFEVGLVTDTEFYELYFDSNDGTCLEENIVEVYITILDTWMFYGGGDMVIYIAEPNGPSHAVMNNRINLYEYEADCVSTPADCQDPPEYGYSFYHGQCYYDDDSYSIEYKIIDGDTA